MLINPGDNILLDAPTYPGTLAAVSIPQIWKIVMGKRFIFASTYLGLAPIYTRLSFLLN